MERYIIGILVSLILVFNGNISIEHPGNRGSGAILNESNDQLVENEISDVSRDPIYEDDIQNEPEPSVEPEIEPRYGFTEEEIVLLAQLVCGSAKIDGDGEYDIDFQEPINYHEVYKVLCVVMNRVRSPKWPNTVYDVVMARNQFAVMPRNASRTPSEKAVETVRAWCVDYDDWIDVQVVPEDHCFFHGSGGINVTTKTG